MYTLYRRGGFYEPVVTLHETHTHTLRNRTFNLIIHCTVSEICDTFQLLFTEGDYHTLLEKYVTLQLLLLFTEGNYHTLLEKYVTLQLLFTEGDYHTLLE